MSELMTLKGLNVDSYSQDYTFFSSVQFCSFYPRKIKLLKPYSFLFCLADSFPFDFILFDLLHIVV